MSKYSETEQIFFSGVVYGFEQPALSILSIRDYRNAKSRIEKVANQPPICLGLGYSNLTLTRDEAE